MKTWFVLACVMAIGAGPATKPATQPIDKPAVPPPLSPTYRELLAENAELKRENARLRRELAERDKPAATPAADAPHRNPGVAAPNDDNDPLGIMSEQTTERFEKKLRADYPGKTVKLSTTATKGRFEIRTWKIYSASGKPAAIVEARFKDGVLVGEPTTVEAGEE